MTKKLAKRDYRLKIHGSNTFLVRRGTHVSYISASETPLALSNLVQAQAAELRFALEDALDGNAAAQAVRASLKLAFPQARSDYFRVEVLL